MTRLRPSRKRLLLTVCSLLALRGASGTQAGTEGQSLTTAPEAAVPKVVGFAPIGDVQMYYEIQGTGDPILFIHGGGGSTQRSWPKEYAADLSRNFMVIMADSRGHGHSTDGAGPITFGRLALDAVRLLDHLGIPRAHVVGHSAGAIAGLHLLVDSPDRVKTATLLAGAYHVDNYRPQALADLKRELDALIRGEKIESRLASKPRSVLEKLHSAWLSGPSFSLRVLETIRRPTLIVAAGQDTFFAPAVAEQMHAHIKGSELIHFPDATHRVQVTNGKELVPAIRDFIARRGSE
jgi:pimeloyl-ACP methyl ester carboxylesterase